MVRTEDGSPDQLIWIVSQHALHRRVVIAHRTIGIEKRYDVGGVLNERTKMGGTLSQLGLYASTLGDFSPHLLVGALKVNRTLLHLLFQGDLGVPKITCRLGVRLHIGF